MLTISAEYLLATILRQTERIELKQFKVIARDIETLTGVVVMNSRDDIAFALHYYPNVCTRQNDFIVRTEVLDFDYYYYEFVVTVQPKIHEKIEDYVLQKTTSRDNRSSTMV